MIPAGSRPLLPGRTVGVVGGGQLGRMLGIAARRMGYRFSVLAPGDGPPAAAVADHHLSADLDDVAAFRKFAVSVDVVTLEFENVSAEALAAAEERAPVRPGPRALHLTQHRGREKSFLATAGVPTAEFRLVADEAGLHAALEEIAVPCIVKTAGFGYDGKGQVVVEEPRQVGAALELVRGGPVVVERRVDLAAEISVVVARTEQGETAAYAPFVNRHVDQVLDVTVAPFVGDTRSWRSVTAGTAEQATAMASRLADALELVGVCCVEYFVAAQGELLVNEIAPRPHNSGHLTIEAAPASQFEQQLRAVCGLPLGSTELFRPAAMANLLGDLWSAGEPDFAAALKVPGVALHLYGKTEARPGRKMGHLSVTADTGDEAEALVLEARAALSG